VSRTPVAGRLLSIAAELFWRRGYAGTSTRELSRELGLQKASLYYHVEKKEDLLHSICVDSLTNITARARQEMDGAISPVARLEALIRGHVGAVLEDRDKHATGLTELRSLSPERRAEVIALRDRYEEMVRALILEAQRCGELRADLSAKVLTLGLLDMLNWSIFWFKERGELSPNQLAAAFTSLFLDGARPR
jgi:TetR/AcrR family transcriptional regulator, cholesterol catabolism regulator